MINFGFYLVDEEVTPFTVTSCKRSELKYIRTNKVLYNYGKSVGSP